MKNKIVFCFMLVSISGQIYTTKESPSRAEQHIKLLLFNQTLTTEVERLFPITVHQRCPSVIEALATEDDGKNQITYSLIQITGREITCRTSIVEFDGLTGSVPYLPEVIRNQLQKAIEND